MKLDNFFYITFCFKHFPLEKQRFYKRFYCKVFKRFQHFINAINTNAIRVLISIALFFIINTGVNKPYLHTGPLACQPTPVQLGIAT